MRIVNHTKENEFDDSYSNEELIAYLMQQSGSPSNVQESVPNALHLSMGFRSQGKHDVAATSHDSFSCEATNEELVRYLKRF